VRRTIALALFVVVFALLLAGRAHLKKPVPDSGWRKGPIDYRVSEEPPDPCPRKYNSIPQEWQGGYPASPEEVKVLLDVPAPYAENVFFFPGGRYLLLVAQDGEYGNYRRFVVYDVEKKRWRPVTAEAPRREGLGEGPYVCVDAECPFLVSVAGRYLEASVEEPECRLDAKIYAEKQIGWNGWGITATPIEHHVADSGRYVLYRVRSFPEDPDSTGVAADVAILRVPNDEDVWFDVINNWLSTNSLETFPVLWRSAPARPVTTASWLHPLLGHRDRLVLITTDRDDAWNKTTHRLVVLEVLRPRAPASGKTTAAPPQRAAAWSTRSIDFARTQKADAYYCYTPNASP